VMPRSTLQQQPQQWHMKFTRRCTLSALRTNPSSRERAMFSSISVFVTSRANPLRTMKSTVWAPKDEQLSSGISHLLSPSSVVLGFFLLSAGPIGFQYAAEIAYPIPEGTSNGLLLLMGQIAGILFIFAMDGLKSPVTGSMDGSLVGLITLLVLCLGLSALLKEPATLLTQAEDAAKARTAARSS